MKNVVLNRQTSSWAVAIFGLLGATMQCTGQQGNTFIPVTPCRIADTRNPNGTFGGPIISGGAAARNFPIPSSACGIPSNATAYSLNFTIVPPGGVGFLAAWPNGQPQPNTSILNSNGRVKASAAIIPAGTGGGVIVYASDNTHVIIDINGYFVSAGTNAAGLSLYTTTPCRVLDTRNAVGPFGGPTLSAGAARTIPVLSSACGLPASAKAYSLNFTAIPKQGLSFLATWPTGVAQPGVSTLNSNGQVTANAAIVPAGSNGSIQVYATDNADLLIDVNGYFAPPSAGGLNLYTSTPCRPYDSRTVNGGAPLSGDAVINVGGTGCLAGLPTPKAYVLSATVVPLGDVGFLSLWPDGSAWPGVSTLNDDDGSVGSNMAIVPTNNGSIDARALPGPTHLILDLNGVFATPPPPGTISGTITLAGTAQPNVTVLLSGAQAASAVTDANGRYSFTVPLGNNYTVTPQSTNFSFSPPAASYNPLNASATQNFSASLTASAPHPAAIKYLSYRLGNCLGITASVLYQILDQNGNNFTGVGAQPKIALFPTNVAGRLPTGVVDTALLPNTSGQFQTTNGVCVSDTVPPIPAGYSIFSSQTWIEQISFTYGGTTWPVARTQTWQADASKGSGSTLGYVIGSLVSTYYPPNSTLPFYNLQILNAVYLP